MNPEELARLASTYASLALTFPAGSLGRAMNWGEAAKYYDLASQAALKAPSTGAGHAGG